MSVSNPFEYGDTPIRDMTHAVAKRVVRLVRAIAEGRIDDRAIAEARGIIFDIKSHAQRRQREARRMRDRGR